MRGSFAVLLLSAVLAGCGTSGGKQRDGVTSTKRDAAAVTARIDKCVDRLVSRSTTSGRSEQLVRRYAKDTYCAPFEQNGWVYADGALSIAAQKWLDNGGRCATSSDGKPPRTVPCEQTNAGMGTRVIDCALLHVVRRVEVMAYIADLQRDGDVRCDDGTSLSELGVP